MTDEMEEYAYWAAYNKAIDNCIRIFKENSWDMELGNTYIQNIIEKFKKEKINNE